MKDCIGNCVDLGSKLIIVSLICLWWPCVL